MDKVNSNQKYFFGKNEVLKYQLVVKIPNDKFQYVQEFDEYDEVFKRYLELETDVRGLLLSINEIQSVTKMCSWNE